MLNFLTATSLDLQNADELQANQRGEITAAQNSRLTASLGFQNGCALLLVFLAFIPLFFIMLIFGGEFVSSKQALPALILIVIFLSLLAGVLLRFGGLWTTGKRWRALKRDRENHTIRQGQGQLAFEKGDYLVRAAGRDLLLPTSTNAGGLKPGATYRFYYLEESGFVLSAEELFPASPAQARSSLLEILANANHFSMEDLELNRNGEITTSQRLRALPHLFFGIVLGAIPLGVGGLILSDNQDFDLLTVLVPAVFVAVFGLIGGFMFFNAIVALLAQAPILVEGVGQKQKRTSGGRSRNTTYYYVIEGMDFQVKKSAFEALVDGERYRVYALPRVKRLLTIEPL